MIYRNSIKCKRCGDEIVSRHHHDFTKCSCGSCSVDGGGAYFKRGGDYWETSLTSADSFEEIREGFEWGSYGKDGNGALKLTKLKDMETDHILAILETQDLKKDLLVLFVKELRFRNVKSLFFRLTKGFRELAN
jgi:hypothetical protein